MFPTFFSRSYPRCSVSSLTFLFELFPPPSFSLVVLCRMPGCASYSIPDGPSEWTLRWLRFPVRPSCASFHTFHQVPRLYKLLRLYNLWHAAFHQVLDVLLELYILAPCILIFGRPFKLLVGCVSHSSPLSSVLCSSSSA